MTGHRSQQGRHKTGQERKLERTAVGYRLERQLERIAGQRREQ